MTRFAVLMAVLIACAGFARPAHAQVQGLDVQVTVVGRTGALTGLSTSDHMLSFSGPVRVPGVGLAPGEYIFRFLSPTVVQVTNENRSFHAMFFVTPKWRRESTTNYAVTLRRVQTGAPARIEALFLPNAPSGYEFIYTRPETATDVARMAMK